MDVESSGVAPWGAGEIEAAVAAFDWSSTSLGPRANWPERLKLTVEQVLACPVVSAVVCGSDRILIYNANAARLYGDRHPHALGRPLPETFAEGWAAVGPLYERAFGGESVHVPTQRLDVDGSGRLVTFDAVLTPVRGNNGEVAYVQMTGQDVTARLDGDAAKVKQARMMEVLVAELQHRARNSFTLIQAVANETVRETGAPDGFMTTFSERLASLARVQDLVSFRDGESVTFRDLVERELEALGADLAGGRVSVDGPDVPLERGTVQTLGLVVHELATNARKYGALTESEGRLVVRWSVVCKAPEAFLRVEWVESGCRSVCDEGASSSATGGYGRKLIERALPFALNARTQFELLPEGVRCLIELPLSKASADSVGA